LDVKLELKIRHPDGRVVEKLMPSGFSPPGLRFPNGGVINNHFVVSGTYLTSTRQEYAFWALNLKTLNWHRVETGSNNLLSGSWNRGILWSRRNTYVVLGDRRRRLADDYNQRRTNFSNMCTVELEAFGLYDNPRVTEPHSNYNSASSSTNATNQDIVGGGQSCFVAANTLGRVMLGLKEFSDMDFLAIGGERVPVNSHIVASRWGPFFGELRQEVPSLIRSGSGGDSLATPHPAGQPFRNSMSTLAPSISASSTDAPTLINGVDVEATPRPPQRANMSPTDTLPSPTKPASKYTTHRPVLYLPHTHPTIQALVHFLYTSSLAPPTSPLSSPQTLCSLLQIARPYRVDGLLEAVVERLHQSMDADNTAAIFNAAAMAAGGGDTVRFASNAPAPSPTTLAAQRHISHPMALKAGPPPRVQAPDAGPSEADQDSAWEDETSASGESSPGSEASEGERRRRRQRHGDEDAGDEHVWRGSTSAVVGLQKRGLRGLIEGRRLRMDRLRLYDGASETQLQHQARGAGEGRGVEEGGAVGLGIA